MSSPFSVFVAKLETWSYDSSVRVLRVGGDSAGSLGLRLGRMSFVSQTAAGCGKKSKGPGDRCEGHCCCRERKGSLVSQSSSVESSVAAEAWPQLSTQQWVLLVQPLSDLSGQKPTLLWPQPFPTSSNQLPGNFNPNLPITIFLPMTLSSRYFLKLFKRELEYPASHKFPFVFVNDLTFWLRVGTYLQFFQMFLRFGFFWLLVSNSS